MGTARRPRSCQEVFPPLHPGSLKVQVFGLREGQKVQGPGSGREGGWVGQALLDLKSGSAGGQEVPGFRPSSEGMWAPCIHMRRHAHVGTHAGMLETCAFVWAHAQTCSSSRLHISRHSGKNTLKWNHANTHTVMLRCTWTPMWSHTHRYASTHPRGWAQVCACVHCLMCTGVPVWDGMKTCAQDT